MKNKQILALFFVGLLLLTMTFITGCSSNQTIEPSTSGNSGSDSTSGDNSIDNEMNNVVVSEDSGMEFGDLA